VAKMNMSRRKGELSPARVDREWPHQVMLPANDCTGQNYNVIHEFCADLSLCPRGHSIMKNDEWHRVFCFADAPHAGKFMERFGGEWFDPARRGRGNSWSKIKPPKQRYY
jgi:hypothetical protein